MKMTCKLWNSVVEGILETGVDDEAVLRCAVLERLRLDGLVEPAVLRGELEDQGHELAEEWDDGEVVAYWECMAQQGDL